MTSNIAGIRELTSNLINYLPKLGAGVLIWLIGSWLIDRLIKLVKTSLASRNFDVSLESFLLNLSSIGLKTFLIITVAEQIGFQTTLFVTILGAFSLAIGLALQGTLANFAGGVLILIFRPFKVGDFIEAHGHSGTVTEIQIFNTVLLASNSKTIIIPNGILSNGSIINTSRKGSLLFELKIEVDRRSNIDQIRNLILPIMDNDTRILKDPAPSVAVSGFGSGYFLLVTGLTHPGEQDSVSQSLYEKIAMTFTENHISGPQVVHNANLHN